MNKIVIAIDPGRSGAIAVITSNGIETFNMDNTEADISNFLQNLLEMYLFDLPPGVEADTFCIIEKVWSRPMQSSQSGDIMMQNYGFMRGLLTAMKIPFSEVLPRKWQQEFITSCQKAPRLDKEATKEDKKNNRNINARYKREHKARLKGIAQQFYPNIKVTLANADAILIARYCELINK